MGEHESSTGECFSTDGQLRNCMNQETNRIAKDNHSANHLLPDSRRRVKWKIGPVSRPVCTLRWDGRNAEGMVRFTQ